MSNAQFYTSTDHVFAAGLVPERIPARMPPFELDPLLARGYPPALHSNRSVDELTPSAFLHEAMQSARKLLALSTVARLMLDKERRQSKEQPGARAEGPALAGIDQVFSSLSKRQDADGDICDLGSRIRELEASLKHIAASDLPDMTRNIVRQRILGQIDLLRGQLAVNYPHLFE